MRLAQRSYREMGEIYPWVEGPYQPKLDIGKVLRIFLYVPTPTKLTNAISKTKKGAHLGGGGLARTPPFLEPKFAFLKSG